MTDPAVPALAALLLPACAFVILALAGPFRRLGRPAAYLSIVFSAAALVAAIGALRLAGTGGYSERLWTWIPAEAGPLATVGVLADGDSALMLVLVALVSFRSRSTRWAISPTRPCPRSAATTPTSPSSRFR